MRFAALLVLVALASSVHAQQAKIDLSKLPPAAQGQMDFTRDIHPIFAKACYSCHGPDKQRGGLRLDDRAAAMQGSNSGAVIKPGKSLESRLLHVVGGLDPEVLMPPKEKTPLTKIEIAKLRAWIDQGATWPQTIAKTAQAKSNHWAFQPITRPRVPTVKNHNPIDAFILDRLHKEKLAPNPEADRTTLIRRLHFDLLGLPPSPAEVDAFLNDMSPNAYEKLVDRILSSPHYGERWGRHWLDLARYADSDGYEADRPRPFAWRYRNWVIDAFNRDTPFDQFTIEQLAGDLLPNATLAQKTATGFHRNTLTNKEGGTDKEQFRVEACVDRVNTTFKAFFGLTIGCAQCHDHKYDPFSQREYYQLFALFNSDEEVDVPAAIPGDGYAKLKAAFDKARTELQAKLDDYKKNGLVKSASQWEQNLKPAEREKLPANIAAILKVTAEKRSMKQQADLLAYFGKLDSKLAELTKAITVHERSAPKEPVVPALALGKGRKTHVMIRGDFLRPGVEVNAGTPAALHPVSHGPQPVGLQKMTRLDLAKWIVQPENPLTARVISNWVWHKFFGRGLVHTLEDFGTQGEKPSHPELLDFLASYFMGEAKWSFKELHKLIVTSATYKQSSKVRPELLTRDPANVLLARQSRLRLEGELIRDNALAAGGLLHRAIGGPSVKPPQPPGISELTYANSARWVESKGPDRYRRGMYTWFQRTSPYPMLMTFDAPDGVLCCVRREKSNTPLQALTLLNDTVFVECAQALAKRILTEAGSTDRIDHAFRICLARRPTEKERMSLSQLLQDLISLARSNPSAVAPLPGSSLPPGVDASEAAAWVAMARTLLNLDEFVTRE